MQNFLSRHTLRHLVSLFLALYGIFSSTAYATDKEPVSIENAWVRPTSAGQEISAAYMTLSSAQNVTLVGIESDVSKSVEIHSMTMKNGVMKMRMLDTLPLAAEKPYKLAPGGFHLMLFDLKKPLTSGEQVKFVLHFKKRNKVEFKQTIKVIVQTPPDNES